MIYYLPLIALAYYYTDIFHITLFSNWTEEHGQKLSSILSTTCIVLIGNLFSIEEGCAAFLMYLILDTFGRKSFDSVTIDTIIHHSIGMLLSSCGILLIGASSNKLLISKTILCLLNMEITTPFLHLAWMFKKDRNYYGCIVSFLFLIGLWIPFRIVYPVQMLFEFLNDDTESLVLVQTLIFGLISMQFYWFYKLCVVGIKTIKMVYHV